MPFANGIGLPQPPPGTTRWPWTEAPPVRESPLGPPFPRVSIVMPSLNHGAFFEEALRSVLLQDYPAIELIVVDGGSVDGSIETIDRYRGWLAHCICERDRGPADALNKGFGLATGEIFGFLNADDYLMPGSVTKIVREFLAHPA